MTITYQLDENDFLTHQLYIASKSERIKRKRKRSKILVPILYAIFGLFFLFQGNISLCILFFIIGLLWYFIYPKWERRHYINHYKGFIKENYRERVSKIAMLEFENDYILAKDDGSEGKILTSEVLEVIEIPSIILVRLKSGHSFILPKDKISDIDDVINKLKELAAYLKINYNIDRNWEWK